VVMKGRYEGAEDMLDFEELTLDLGLQGRFILPATDGHPMPLMPRRCCEIVSQIPPRKLQRSRFRAAPSLPSPVAWKHASS